MTRLRMSIVALLFAGLFTLAAPSPDTYAATPPDSCFAFNAGTGTITDYYDYEANNPANPACPRDVDIPSTVGGTPVTVLGSLSLRNNQLTAITIPSSVVDIQSNALSSNLLTSIVIPTSVTTIGGSAFFGNQLTTVTVPSSVTSIGSQAFAFNQLSSATIENSSATMTHNSFVNNPIESMTVGSNTYTEQSPTTETACYSIFTDRLGDYYQASPLVARDNGVLCGRNVAIPDGITVIGNYAFYLNEITAVSLPDSVVEIENYAFWSNKISSLTLGSNLTTIGQHSFFMNSIVEVAVPDSLSSIGIGAFSLQSQWGGDIEYGHNGAPDIYSLTPSEVQEVYDGTWYVRLNTETPSNPSGLLSATTHEDSWVGFDGNANSIEDSIGGHIINPARATIQYRNAADQSISTNQMFTGMIAETYINDYLVTNGPIIPVPADSYSPTPAELTAINDAFDVYYRIGDSVTIDPPAIDGYITPEPQTFVLGAADNTFSYVYAAADSPGGGGPTSPTAPSSNPDGELADTGWNITAVYLIAITVLGSSVVLWKLHSRVGAYRR